MNYLQYQFTISPIEPWREILLAMLSECGFESFEDTSEGLNAYIRKSDEDKSCIIDQINFLSDAKINFIRTEIETKNWNEIWESNFHPILVDNQCYIRAEFHEPKPEIHYEIIIQPKMSFGTGHHETTYLMVEYLLETDCKNKTALDMGCGTSILAILAKKKGASRVEAIDIDEWAVENSIENAERNHVKLNIHQGDAELLNGNKFDLVIANINKNILMADIPIYSNCLTFAGSELILSGLMEFDEVDIRKVCEKNGLKFESKKQKNEWIALKFIKV